MNKNTLLRFAALNVGLVVMWWISTLIPLGSTSVSSETESVFSIVKVMVVVILVLVSLTALYLERRKRKASKAPPLEVPTTPGTQNSP